MEEAEPQKPNEKALRREAAERRSTLRRVFWIVGIIALAAMLAGGGIFLNRRGTRNLPGHAVSDQGQEHVAPGHQFVYNSNPPTSGPHFASPAEWGVYREELPDQTFIHNLEHGGIWISYKPGVPDDVREKLEGFYQTWGRKIIVAPRAKNDSDVALAAWNHLDAFNLSEFSEERVERFIKAFRNRGPEFVP